MPGAFAYLVALVFFVIALNFYFLYRRLRRDRYRKPGKQAMEEKIAAELRAREIQRRLDREQEDMANRVELRNKTLELYEIVRKNAALREKELLLGQTSVDQKPTDEEPDSEAESQNPDTL
jgi:predicted Holliday junction resolvase-like endonuclease